MRSQVKRNRYTLYRLMTLLSGDSFRLGRQRIYKPGDMSQSATVPSD
jgi:hypothetical protein